MCIAAGILEEVITYQGVNNGNEGRCRQGGYMAKTKYGDIVLLSFENLLKQLRI
jgi:hypothetical protein